MPSCLCGGRKTTQESVLSFTKNDPRIKLRLSGLVAGFLILRDISPTFETALLNAWGKVEPWERPVSIQGGGREDLESISEVTSHTGLKQLSILPAERK